MCTVKSRYRKSTSVTGYKVAIEHNNKFYSIYTGIQYKVGPVMELPQTPKKPNIDYEDKYATLGFYFDKRVWDNNSAWYSSKMKNKTGVILSFELAHDFMNSQDNNNLVVLLEMTISTGLYNAEFDSMKTVVGRNINSIKKLSKEDIDELNAR